MRGAWRELEARGRPVKAVKIGPDGSVVLLTETVGLLVAANEGADEVADELEAWRRGHGYG